MCSSRSRLSVTRWSLSAIFAKPSSARRAHPGAAGRGEPVVVRKTDEAAGEDSVRIVVAKGHHLVHATDMATWASLIGVIIGATITFIGQFVVQRIARRTDNVTLVLEQCALLVALNEDFRNRLWEEREGLSEKSVSKWAVGEFRLAEARLRILSGDSVLIDALNQLRSSGQELGTLWRTQRRKDDTLATLWKRNTSAQNEFINAARAVIRHHFSGL